jgi:hypothetical protein
VATLNAAWPLDVMRKARKALVVDGPTFLHAIVPCTRGWRYPTDKTIEISRLATQTCLFPLYECRLEEGRPVYELSAPSAAIARRPEAKKPVVEYLEPQGRFRHLFRPERRDDLIDSIQGGRLASPLLFISWDSLGIVDGHQRLRKGHAREEGRRRDRALLQPRSDDEEVEDPPAGEPDRRGQRAQRL